MKSSAATVEEYLASLPEDRRPIVEHIRKIVLDNLPAGLEEGMQYGMIGYYVPHSLYPKGYHCDPKVALPFMHIGNQKGHVGLYLFCLYGSPEHAAKFQEAWTAAGKKVDKSTSCYRIKKISDVADDVLANTLRSISVDGFIAKYETLVPANRSKK